MLVYILIPLCLVNVTFPFFLLLQLDEWLYEEGFDQDATVYRSRLSELTVLFDPIKDRVQQHRDRPEALQASLYLGLALLTALALAGVEYLRAERRVGGEVVGRVDIGGGGGEGLGEAIEQDEGGTVEAVREGLEGGEGNIRGRRVSNTESEGVRIRRDRGKAGVIKGTGTEQDRAWWGWLDKIQNLWSVWSQHILTTLNLLISNIWDRMCGTLDYLRVQGAFPGRGQRLGMRERVASGGQQHRQGQGNGNRFNRPRSQRNSR